MGPTRSTQWDRCARVRVNPKLGLTDYSNSVGPIWVISETEIWPSKLGGTDCISRWDRFALSVRPKSYERETESLQSRLGETEIPIGRTELLGFGSGL